MSFFPEDKDLAHKIMMDLPNSDLVKLCATNKRLHAVCNNYPDFWRNKFIKDYGEHAAKYKPEGRSWKNHYMTVFIDLQKYKKYPLRFLNVIAWKDNVENSFFLDYEGDHLLVPLKEAPDWVMENLYLLNLGDIEVKDLAGVVTHYKNVKPIELLEKQIPTTNYIHGMLYKIGPRLYPQYSSLVQIFNSK